MVRVPSRKGGDLQREGDQMFLNSTTARRAGKDPPVYRAGIFRGGGEMPTIIAPDFRGMMYLPKEVPGGSRDDYFPFEGDIAPD